MTNAAKWKEFLRWWEEENKNIYNLVYNTNIILAINDKIKELQRGDNAKQ